MCVLFVFLQVHVLAVVLLTCSRHHLSLSLSHSRCHAVACSSQKDGCYCLTVASVRLTFDDLSSMTASSSACLSRFLFVLALLSVTPRSALAQLSPAVNLTILSAAGDGTCENVGGVAYNCTSPFTLNLTVVSLPNPVCAYCLSLNMPNVSSFYVQADLFGATYTTTLISTRVTVGQYRLPSLTALSVFLSWQTTVNGSRAVQQFDPAPAFSLQPWRSSCRDISRRLSGCRDCSVDH